MEIYGARGAPAAPPLDCPSSEEKPNKVMETTRNANTNVVGQRKIPAEQSGCEPRTRAPRTPEGWIAPPKSRGREDKSEPNTKTPLIEMKRPKVAYSATINGVANPMALAYNATINGVANPRTLQSPGTG